METKAEYATQASPYLSEVSIIEASIEVPFVCPGIYFLIERGEIVYVGQSEYMVLSRLASHAQKRRFDRVTVLKYPRDADLNRIEAEYIWRLEPKYNGNLPPNPYYMGKARIKEALQVGGRQVNRIIRERKIRSRLGGYYDIRDFQERQE